MASEKQVRNFADRIVKSVLDETFFQKTEGPESHTGRHVIMNNTKLLDRVLSDKRSSMDRKMTKETKQANTGFASLDDAYANIEEAVIYKSKEIAEWVLDPQSKYKESFPVTLSEEEGYGQVGYGFLVERKNNQIKCYGSNCICVVLKKDKNSDLGFTLHTAYPEIMKTDHRTEEIKDINKQALLRKTETYKKASPMAKAYMECQVKENNPYLVTFKEGYKGNRHDEVVSIQIPFKDEEGTQWRNTVRIKENSVEFSSNRMTDVWIIKKQKGNGNTSEKIVYPWEDVEKYKNREGIDVERGKRFVKQRTSFTDTYPGMNELSVSLTNPDALREFSEKHPKAGELVKMCMRNLGMNKKEKAYEVLDERLMPEDNMARSMQPVF